MESTEGVEPMYSFTDLMMGEAKHRFVGELERLYPNAHCELYWRTPFELLVAVILSAQCTDRKVNEVTHTLFERYPDPVSLAASQQEDVEKIVYQTGFFRQKATNIRATAQMLIDKFGGEVPRTMKELIQLPGVARKTANVVLGSAFGIPSGIPVDTHVERVTSRLGLTFGGNPTTIESQLTQLIPQDKWIETGHRLVWLGRRICNAKNPQCSQCPLTCPSRRIV